MLRDRVFKYSTPFLIDMNFVEVFLELGITFFRSRSNKETINGFSNGLILH